MRANHSWKPGSVAISSAVVAILFLLVSTQVAAQEAAYNEQKGFTAFEDFRASDSNQGQFLIMDTNIGYDFSSHFGADVGVPVYVIRPTLPGTPHSWNYNVGDPYGDVRFTFDNPVVNYGSVVTITVPVNETGSFGTGRVGLDWFNHFDKTIYRVTPFVNAGIANGILDTRALSQPFRLAEGFRTLGFLADAEGGMDFHLTHSVSVGGSYYALFPEGDQKAFGGGQNFFLLPTGNESVSDITHDHGYSAWVRFTPTRFVYAEVGYVHSIKLDNDAATLTLGFDLGSLFNRPSAQRHY